MSDTPNQEEKHPAAIKNQTDEKAKAPTPPVPPETQSPSKPIGNQNSNQDKDYRLQRWNLRVQIVLAFATIGVFIAAIIYARFAYKQWCAMDATFGEIQKQTPAIVKTSDASMIAANVAEQTLKSNIDIARRDQRAWVGPVQVLQPTLKDAINKPVYVVEGPRVTFEARIINSGKSPARKVRANANCYLLSAEKPLSPGYSQPMIPVGVLQPQVPYAIRTEIPALTTLTIENIKRGNEILYVFGRITYEDAFTEPHWTIFCMKLNPSLDNFSACNTYNDAN
jgi:hypothetical protein